jgi:hypothetical protein
MGLVGRPRNGRRAWVVGRGRCGTSLRWRGALGLDTLPRWADLVLPSPIYMSNRASVVARQARGLRHKLSAPPWCWDQDVGAEYGPDTNQ